MRQALNSYRRQQTLKSRNDENVEDENGKDDDENSDEDSDGNDDARGGR